MCLGYIAHAITPTNEVVRCTECSKDRKLQNYIKRVSNLRNSKKEKRNKLLHSFKNIKRRNARLHNKVS